MKKLFSERYGYTKPSDVIIRERMTPALQNAICSCYDQLVDVIYNKSRLDYAASKNVYYDMERYVWKYFF